MPRPRSKQTQDALDDIKAGMSQADAGRKHGVDQGQISRMLRLNEKMIGVKLSVSEINWLLDVDLCRYKSSPNGLTDKLENAMDKLKVKQ